MPAPADDVLDRAHRHDRSATEAVLATAYPAVWRIAHALAGPPVVARRVVVRVRDRGVRVLPTWRSGATPENWFYHHTLLAAREAAGGDGDAPRPAGDDPLGRDDTSSPDPGYAAFVRAVRHLPRQQAEAFVLHHGERLNERLLGVAMDCSMVAAIAHLAAATDATNVMAGPAAAGYARRLTRAYAAMTPDREAVVAGVRPHVRRAVRACRARRAARAVAWLVVLVVLAGAAYAGWHWRDLLAGQWHRLR